MERGEKFFSFEYFPPKTEEGVNNLFERMGRMVQSNPTFCDITWGAGGSTADLTMDIATRMQCEVGVETMMHLTCTNMEKDKVVKALSRCKEVGIRNILALRGDPPKGQDKWEAVEGGFNCALDLVRYIRQEFGDHFGIGVAGYPEAHPDSIVEDPKEMEENYWKDIRYLKEKIDAGADFVVTQLFYDTDQFLKFVKDCRDQGIQCPIIPGIMPIMTYNGFKRMTSFCKTKVPKEIADKVEEFKDSDDAIKEYGIDVCTSMCKKILDAGVPGLHMYTLNLEKSAMTALCNLGLVTPPKNGTGGGGCTAQ